MCNVFLGSLGLLFVFGLCSSFFVVVVVVNNNNNKPLFNHDLF